MQRRQARRPYTWLTPLIILVAMVLVAIGAIVIAHVEDYVVATTGERLALATSDIADMLDRILFERYGDVLVISQARVFQEHERTAMTEYLATLKKTYPVYVWLGVTDAKGRIIAATDQASVGQDRSEREWFRAARDRGRVHVLDAQLSEDSQGALAVAFTAPIKSPRGEFLGVVTSRMGIPSLVDIFVKAVHVFQVLRGSPGKIEYQFLTRDGDVIVDSILRQEGEVNLKRLALPSALLIASAQPGYIEERHLRRGVEVISGYAQTRGYGGFTGLHWGILMRMDRNDVLAPIQTVVWNIGAAGAFVVVPLLGFLLWTTRRLRTEWEQAHVRDRAIAAAENGIFITDPNQPTNPVIYVNPALERLTGYGKDEILGRSYRFLLTPDTDPAAVEEIRAALREERECRVAMKNYRRDGTPFWSEMTMSPVRDPGGRLTHFVGVVTDITELNQATDQLRESERMYAQILDSIADMILCKGPQSRILYANKAFRDYYGMTMDQLRGIIDAPFNKQDYTHRYLHDDDRVFGSGKPLNIPEEPVTRHDGKVFLFNTVKSPIFNAAGEVVQLVAVCRDITERKRAEARLAKINECFLSFGTDSKENINRLTGLVGELLGATCAMYNRLEGGLLCSVGQWQTPPNLNPWGEPDGHLCHDVIRRAGDRLLVVRNLSQTPYAETDPNIKQFGLETYMGKSVKCGGTSIGSLCAVFERDFVPSEADERLMGIIASAIGVEEERQLAEEALRESEERFRSAAQSAISAQEEERSRIARELHDETGQSLTALLVGLRTVEDARTIEEARSQAHELRQIAAMTLDEVGRLAWGLRPRVLDDLGLAAALERYGAEFSASRGIAVNVHTKGLDASRLPFPVETALYRIAQEALTNTAKHAKAETVGILVEHHTTFVQMMVEDNGCGFDVDATLKSTGASKHLGLHGMHERAALLKGTIKIESRPGKGTLIDVRIPLSTE